MGIKRPPGGGTASSSTEPEVVVTTLTTTAINTAIGSLPSTGGTIKLLAGSEYVSQGVPVTLPAAGGVIIRGMGRRGSGIKRTGSDHILVDMSGSHASTTTTTTHVRSGLADLYLDGGSNASWTNPLLRTYYTAEDDFNCVDFVNNYGSAVDAVEFWDSTFHHCRFDSVGGTDGTLPAVNIRQTTGAISGMGHSSDNCNNIRLNNCTWESFRDGAIWVDSGAGSGAEINYNVWINNAKMESHSARGPFVKFTNVFSCRLHDAFLLPYAWDSGYSTPFDVIQTETARICSFRNIWVNGPPTDAAVSSCLAHSGAGGACSVHNFWCTFYGPAPTSGGMFDFTGTTNYGWSFDNYGVYETTNAFDLFVSQANTAYNTPGPPLFYSTSTINAALLRDRAMGGDGVPLVGTMVYDATGKKIGVFDDTGGTILWTAALS